MAWLLRLGSLRAGSVAGLSASVGLLDTCWMTIQVFRIHFGALMNRRPPGPDLLLARDLLLVLMWGLPLVLLNTQEKGTR